MAKPRALSSLLLLALRLPLWGQLDQSNVKPAPTRPSTEAEVIVEELEIVDTCEADKICVEGQLHNTGAKTASQVKLRVEIGGTKHSKPRLSLYKKVENPTMEPGDRQDFSLSIDRKVPYKYKQEEKILEVGKYNFKIVPVWAARPKVKNRVAATRTKSKRR